MEVLNRFYFLPNNWPTERTIEIIITKIQILFMVWDLIHLNRMRTLRFEENNASLEGSVNKDPNVSIRRRAQEVDGQSPSTLWKILPIYLCLVTIKFRSCKN